MLLYVVSAILLTIAFLMFSMAMSHKSLLNGDVEQEMLRRLDALSPSAKGRWGRMSAAQMLHHVAEALRMATGDLRIPARSGPLRMFPLKQLIVFILPFPKSAPTAPALLARDEPHFESQRAAVRELLGAFPRREIAAWPDHPAFGALNRDQWGVLAWKHIDHHFRQFGV